MYRHILIATDESELAEKAVKQGIALAKNLKAPVSVVTVTEKWSAFDMARGARQGARTRSLDMRRWPRLPRAMSSKGLHKSPSRKTCPAS